MPTIKDLKHGSEMDRAEARLWRRKDKDGVSIEPFGSEELSVGRSWLLLCLALPRLSSYL